MAEENKNLVTVSNIGEKETEIASKILNEDNLDEVKNLTRLFNLIQAKKNMLRVMNLNGLLDKVSDQMIERFDKRPGEFSNSDLLSYLQVTQAAIDKATKSLNLVEETPLIQVNQNNLNVKVDPQGPQLDRDSKNRITDAIKAILNRVSDIQEIDVTPQLSTGENTNNDIPNTETE